MTSLNCWTNWLGGIEAGRKFTKASFLTVQRVEVIGDHTRLVATEVCEIDEIPVMQKL